MVSKKAKAIEDELERLYPRPRVSLQSHNNFTFLVAVLLSAQCTDKRVNEVSPKLFELADTPEKMAKLKISEIQKIIRPCGLSNTKAKNIKKLSQALVEKFGGKVPRNFDDLESLAGVGHKTASVVMMQAFGVPTFPVDTHIHRLARRWRLASGKSVEDTELHLKKIFPKDKWANLHLQMIFYGRQFCKANTCKTPETMCDICKKFAKKTEKVSEKTPKKLGLK